MRFAEFFSSRLSTLWVALVVVLAVAACAPREPIPLPERPSIPFGEGRIWKVEGDDTAPSYVFGTYHISDPRVLDIPDAAERAFRNAEIAVFEYKKERGKDPDPIDRDRTKLPSDMTLKGLVGAGTYGRLKSIMESRGYRPRNDVKPWVFWRYLGGYRGTFYTTDDESDPTRPVLDDWLRERAWDAGKRVEGFETWEEGFAKFNTIPMDIQVELLRGAVGNYYNRREGAPTVQFYLDGDLAMLHGLWEERMSRYSAEAAETLTFRIITNRNRIMADGMEPLMREASTFVAVGAGHLSGEDGILRMLERRGYRVTRVH